MKSFIYVLILFSNFCYSQQIVTVSQAPINTLIGRINVNDSVCLKEIKRAENDVKKGKIQYSITQFDIDSDKIETISIFKKLINLNDITVNFIGGYLAKNNVTLFCYEKYMDTIIKQKFGKNYIKDNIRKADSLYVVNNKDKVFSNREIFDKQLLYPFAKSLNAENNDYISDFLKNFKIPKGFIQENKKNFNSYVRFNLSKEGKISKIQILTDIYNIENLKFINYFNTKLSNFVKSIKWISQKKYGIILNSEVVLYFSN